MDSRIDLLLIFPHYNMSWLNSQGIPDGGGSFIVYPPLGLAYLAATARERGYNVFILDANAEKTGNNQILAIVEQLRPRIIGIMVFTVTLPLIAELIKKIRKTAENLDESPIMVLGGPHVSCDPEIILHLDGDYGIIGDGELKLAALCDFLLRGKGSLENISGLITHLDGEIHINPGQVEEQFVDYPVPWREGLTSNKYFNPVLPVRTTSALSVRGCPHQCSFCCRSPAMGSYRPRRLEYFLEELALIDSQGYGFVSIVDETFSHSRERAVAICEFIIDNKLRIKWGCQTRADALDEELAGLMKRAGCLYASLGVETGSEEGRGAINKHVSNDSVKKAFSFCRKAGLGSNAFLMIGNPGESRSQALDNIDFVISLRPDYLTAHVATLLPGTLFYKQYLEEGGVSAGVWAEYSKGNTRLPVLSKDISHEDLHALAQKAFSSFYLRPGYVFSRLKLLRSPRQMMHLARQARTVFLDFISS